MGGLKIVTVYEARVQVQGTGWSSFCDWQVISRGGCWVDPTKQEHDLQPKVFHREEKETNEEKVKENIDSVG